MKNSLPTPIKIGPHRWKFKWMSKRAKKPTPYSYTDENGYAEISTHTIFIHPELSPSKLAETVWHEVTHAINDTYGIEDASTEEQFTCQSSVGWMQVQIDSPHFIDYITTLLHPPKVADGHANTAAAAAAAGN